MIPVHSHCNYFISKLLSRSRRSISSLFEFIIGEVHRFFRCDLAAIFIYLQLLHREGSNVSLKNYPAPKKQAHS